MEPRDISAHQSSFDEERYADVFSEIMHILRESYTPRGIIVWLTKQNRHLDHKTPMALINAGKGERVRDVAVLIESEG